MHPGIAPGTAGPPPPPPFFPKAPGRRSLETFLSRRGVGGGVCVPPRGYFCVAFFASSHNVPRSTPSSPPPPLPPRPSRLERRECQNTKKTTRTAAATAAARNLLSAPHEEKRAWGVVRESFKPSLRTVIFARPARSLLALALSELVLSRTNSKKTRRARPSGLFSPFFSFFLLFASPRSFLGPHPLFRLVFSALRPSLTPTTHGAARVVRAPAPLRPPPPPPPLLFGDAAQDARHFDLRLAD